MGHTKQASGSILVCRKETKSCHDLHGFVFNVHAIDTEGISRARWTAKFWQTLSARAVGRHDRRHHVLIASGLTSGLTASSFRLRFRVCKVSLMPFILKSRRAVAGVLACLSQSVGHAVTTNNQHKVTSGCLRPSPSTALRHNERAFPQWRCSLVKANMVT